MHFAACSPALRCHDCADSGNIFLRSGCDSHPAAAGRKRGATPSAADSKNRAGAVGRPACEMRPIRNCSPRPARWWRNSRPTWQRSETAG